MNAVLHHRDAGSRSSIEAVIQSCKRAETPTRELDAEIALALFPSLRALAPIAPGIWQNTDGSHVRALRYSSSWAAAATIVPPGCWIEAGSAGPRVAGPGGEWDGVHEMRAIALSIAALGARIGEDSHDLD